MMGVPSFSQFQWSFRGKARSAGWIIPALAIALAALGPATALRAQESNGDPSALQAALAIEKALVEAIERAEQSIVAIARVPHGTLNDPSDPRFVPHEFGAGVVIDSAGLILTNYHVLGDPEKNDYVVWVKRRPFRIVEVLPASRIQGADPWTDLAILKIDAEGLEPIRLGDGGAVRKGQLVVSLGNPYAIARDGDPSATWGIVSNLSRQIVQNPTELNDEGAETLHHYGTLIQVDAKLELGTSGGALINLRGEMIGLTSSLAAMSQFETSAGFAIPVDDTFRQVVDKLKRGEEPEFGFLGVSPRDLDEQLRRDGRLGVSVAQVIDGTPAAIAGIRFGDTITHIDGQGITDSSELMRNLGRRSADEIVVVSVQRKRVGEGAVQRLQLPVRLSKKYLNSVRPVIAPQRRPTWRGMRVDYATAIDGFAERSRFVDEQGCVAIVEVERDSPAWVAGLRPREFVSHVGETRVSSPDEFLTAVDAANGEVELLMTYAPRGESPTRTIRPKVDD